MEKTGAERVKYSLACQHEDAISIKFVSYAQKCPTVLCTFAVALRKESVDRNHDYRLIRKDSITRCRRRIRRYAAGEVSWNQLQEQLTSWTGHASHADAYGIVRKIWAEALAAKAARESANKDGEAYDGARDSPRSA